MLSILSKLRPRGIIRVKNNEASLRRNTDVFSCDVTDDVLPIRLTPNKWLLKDRNIGGILKAEQFFLNQQHEKRNRVFQVCGTQRG